jgi:hypothetical protein
MKTNKHFSLYLANFFLECETFQIKFIEKIKIHVVCSITFFFENRAICEIVCKNIVEPDRPRMIIRLMRIGCCIPKATYAHSDYVIFTALPLQQWLRERAIMLRYTYLYIAWLVEVPFVLQMLLFFFCYNVKLCSGRKVWWFLFSLLRIGLNGFFWGARWGGTQRWIFHKSRKCCVKLSNSLLFMELPIPLIFWTLNTKIFLDSCFQTFAVLWMLCFLLGNSPASEFYRSQPVSLLWPTPTLMTFLMTQAIFELTFSCINTLTILKPSHSSYLPAYEDGRDSVPKRRHIKFRRRGITQKKTYIFWDVTLIRWTFFYRFCLHFQESRNQRRSWTSWPLKMELINFSRNIGNKIPTFSAHSLHRSRELRSSELLRIVW